VLDQIKFASDAKFFYIKNFFISIRYSYIHVFLFKNNYTILVFQLNMFSVVIQRHFIYLKKKNYYYFDSLGNRFGISSE